MSSGGLDSSPRRPQHPCLTPPMAVCLLVLGTGGGACASPARSEGLGLTWGFQGFCLQAFRKGWWMCMTHASIFLQYFYYSEVGNQIHLALLNNPTTSSEEASGLKYMWTARGFSKMFSHLPSPPCLHLTSLLERILPKWPERIFHITLFKKEKKKSVWTRYAILFNSGLLLLLATYNWSSSLQNIEGLWNGI